MASASSPPSSSRIPDPPQPSLDPSISAVSPSRPWPWSPPKTSTPLELLQIHYYIRHGERTPVRTRMTDSNPPIPSRWDLCHAGKEFRASVLSSQQPHQQRSSSHRQGFEMAKGVEVVEKDEILKPLDGECLMGELTDTGRLSTFTLGKYLREIYVDRLGFLSFGSASDEQKLYVRSTNIPRTIESAQQVVRGLLGDDKQTHDHDEAGIAAFRPKILIRNGPSENLLPNTYSCPTLFKLDAQFSRTVASLLNPSLEEHDPILSPHLGGVPARVDGHPRLSGILDTVRAATAHGFEVPEVFTRPEVVKSLERAVCSEWFYGYTAPDLQQRATYRRLAMGPLLGDLAERLKKRAREKTDAKDPLKMAIYSTHDTTLAGILSTLDCFPNRWPAFTSSIGVELYRDVAQAEQARNNPTVKYMSLIMGVLDAWYEKDTPSLLLQGDYLRLLYNGQPLRIPACAGQGNHHKDDDTLCTLNAFLVAVEKLKREDGMGWEEECALGRGDKSSK